MTVWKQTLALCKGRGLGLGLGLAQQLATVLALTRAILRTPWPRLQRPCWPPSGPRSKFQGPGALEMVQGQTLPLY